MGYFCPVLSEPAEDGARHREPPARNARSPRSEQQNKFNLRAVGRFALSALFDPSFTGKIEVIPHQAQHIDLQERALVNNLLENMSPSSSSKPNSVRRANPQGCSESQVEEKQEWLQGIALSLLHLQPVGCTYHMLQITSC